MSHTGVFGKSGSGKTTAQIPKIERDPDKVNVVLDIHDSFGLGCADRMDALGIPFLVSDLANKALPLEYFYRSTNVRENEETCRMLLRAFAAIQGRDDLRKNPYIEKYGILSGNLWLYQSVDVPQSWLQYSLDTYSNEFSYMIQNCTSSMTKDELIDLSLKTEHQQELQAGGTKRMIKRLFVDQFVLGMVKVRDLLEDGISLIVVRGNQGLISPETATAMMHLTLEQIFRYARKRPKPKPIINVVIDEFARSGLCGELVASALAELRKFGVAITVISQDLEFGKWKQVILQNLGRKEWFQSSDPDVLDVAGRDIATRGFDHTRISHIETQERNYGNKKVKEERERYMTLADQIKKAEQMVINLNVGERIVTE